MLEPINQNTRAGHWQLVSVPDEPYRAFIPAPLPPNPALTFDARLHELLERANRALGRLDGVTALLPDPDLFLYSYIRKEAVLSSQIEGTQSSLSELLLFENEAAPGVPLDDVRGVSNYVAALQHGVRRLKENFPLSLRLLREIHGVLLREGRGSDKEPGEFRRSQNWIGGSRPGKARYVPPPPHEVLPAMSALERFFHDEPVKTSPVIKAGLAHAQFESIHPFLDGNGRVGRLLITLILLADGVVSTPLLYLSFFFKKNRTEYYDLLQNIRTQGGWEAWLAFYLAGIEEVGNQASGTARKLSAMFQEHKIQIRTLGRASFTAERVHNLLQSRVIVSPVLARKELKMSFPAINKAMANLQKLGFVREITGKQSYRVFAYDPYLKILNEDTERPVSTMTSGL
jgi:Fic family protein